MKVLMTADAVGGVWTYALELARALRKYDVEIVLAVMGPPPSEEQRHVVESLSNVQLVDRDYRLEWMESPWRDVAKAGEWLRELADRHRVDLVHVNGYAHAALDWHVPVLVVAHSCVCTWWEAVHGVPAPAEWDAYRDHIVAGLAAADMVIAPTAAFLRDLQRLHGRVARTRVIRNALPAPQMEVVSRDRIVFACGRAWDEAKNLTCLDDAAAELPCDVFVAGDWRGPDGRQRRFKSLHTLGTLPLPSVHSWMARAAIFAHPAVYEPFGLAVLEAAQRGCALVLSDVPTLRELWEGAAVFADGRNAQSFRKQLRSLLDDVERRESLAEAARERATGFRSDTMAQAYWQAYGELLNAHHERFAVA